MVKIRALQCVHIAQAPFSGVDIVANRLFGPMPRTSTYLCIWEINLGHCKLDMSLGDVQILAQAGRSFGLGFTDLANAPATEYMPPVDPDSMYI